MARLDALLGGLGGLRRNRKGPRGREDNWAWRAGLPACGYIGRGPVLRTACAVCLGLAEL